MDSDNNNMNHGTDEANHATLPTSPRLIQQQVQSNRPIFYE